MAERGGWRGWHVPAVALGVVLLLGVVRVWLPSVIFIYGRAGSTPATTMGAFALAWFLVGFLAVPLARRIGARTLTLGATVVLGVATVALSLQVGGEVQLYAASVGLLAGMAWLVGLAVGTADRHATALGIAVGLAGETALHATLETVDLVWRSGSTAVLVVGLIALAWIAATTADHALTPAGPPAGPAWTWLAVGPILLLAGMLSGLSSRAMIAADIPPWAAASLLVLGHGLAVVLVLAAPSLPRMVLGIEAAILTLGGTILALPADGPLAVIGQLLLAAGLAGTLGILAVANGATSPGRRGAGAAGGMLLLFIVGFAYYADYDIDLGPNRLVLVAAALLLAAIAILGGRHGGRARCTAPVGQSVAAVSLAAVIVAAGAGIGAGSHAADLPTRTGDGLPVRVMVYNLHMGYDTEGRFDAAGLASVIQRTDASIVALNEVDRGWFLNGGHDILEVIADQVGMPYVFAPAADEVWGNAILSAYPLSDVRRTLLPQAGVPMRRGALSAVADLGDGDRIAVVVTHLHHVEGDDQVRQIQAQAVAEFAQPLIDAGLPTVLLGDLNAQPPAAVFDTFADAGLTDAVGSLGDPLTYPSWGPEKWIDHILVSEGLTASELEVPASQASDHLGVAVTLDLR